jgi:hypothetical protein
MLNDIASCAQRINFKLESTWPCEICGTPWTTRKYTDKCSDAWMSNATIVDFAFGSKNARGVLFEDHTIVNVVLQGKFFCLLFTPRQSTWRCYKIDKMPNCVNISIRTMLHSHLCPQGSIMWASSLDQECIPTKCREDSITWLVTWNPHKGSCHTFFRPMCMMRQMKVWIGRCKTPI